MTRSAGQATNCHGWLLYNDGAVVAASMSRSAVWRVSASSIIGPPCAGFRGLTTQPRRTGLIPGGTLVPVFPLPARILAAADPGEAVLAARAGGGCQRVLPVSAVPGRPVSPGGLVPVWPSWPVPAWAAA